MAALRSLFGSRRTAATIFHPAGTTMCKKLGVPQKINFPDALILESDCGINLAKLLVNDPTRFGLCVAEMA
jgi:hypothetical protein